MDETKIEQTAWAIISKDKPENTNVKLNDEALFQLWRVYNRLICDDSTTVHVEEIGLLLKDFMESIGCGYDSETLDDFTDHSRLSFWDFVKCLETEYLHDISERLVTFVLR